MSTPKTCVVKDKGLDYHVHDNIMHTTTRTLLPGTNRWNQVKKSMALVLIVIIIIIILTTQTAPTMTLTEVN